MWTGQRDTRKPNRPERSDFNRLLVGPASCPLGPEARAGILGLSCFSARGTKPRRGTANADPKGKIKGERGAGQAEGASREGEWKGRTFPGAPSRHPVWCPPPQNNNNTSFSSRRDATAIGGYRHILTGQHDDPEQSRSLSLAFQCWLGQMPWSDTRLVACPSIHDVGSRLDGQPGSSQFNNNSKGVTG